MKHVYRLLIILVTILVIVFTIKYPKVNNYNIENNKYNSYNFVEEVVKLKEENNSQIIEKPKEELNVENKEELPNIKDESNSQVLETLVANISGYGHDCYGCTSGYTASGYYIGDGTMYYEDSTYGKIRVVAADKKYQFGTIVRISNFINEDTFYAIVLDRGGAIGLDKRIQFDLLYPKNNDAIPVGIQTNVIFEILRLGF